MLRVQRPSLVAGFATLAALLHAGAAVAQSRDGLQSAAMRACDRVRVAAERSLQASATALRIPRATPFHASGYNVCIDANRGAWLVGVDRPVLRRIDGRAALMSGDVTLTFFTAEGAAIRASGDVLGPHRRVADRPTVYPSVRDFDGDDVGDLVFEAYGTRALHIFTAHDGRVSLFVPPTNVRANATSDIDRDGRYDLLEYVSFAQNEECQARGLSGSELISWAAVQDGRTYRSDNESARAWLRAQCPERPQVYVPTHGVTPSNATAIFREVLQRVACGRVWGASAEAIGRALPARWPAPIACMTSSELVTFAASIRPPVTLAPITGVTAPRPDAETHFTTRDIDDFDPPSLPVPQELPVLVRRCTANENAMRRSFTAVVNASNQSISLDELDEFFGNFAHCYVSEARDVWMTAFERLRWVENTDTDESGFTGTSRITHLDVSGRAVSQQPDTISRFDGRVSTRRVIATFDFDGDRSSEAIVRSNESDGDEDSGNDFDVLTVSNGAIRRYQPAGGVPTFTRLVDFDEDERPDLVNLSCNVQFDDDREEYSGPRCLAHSRPDGTFSMDDAVARSFIAAQCTAPPERLVAVAEGGGSVERYETYGAILCARYYGENAERIVQRIVVESRTRDEDDRRWLNEISKVAAWRMRFTLPRPTPAPLRSTTADAGTTP